MICGPDRASAVRADIAHIKGSPHNSASHAVLGIFLYWSLTRPAAPGVTTYIDIALPEGHALFSDPAISPDGSTVAFVSAGPSEMPRLYIRRLVKDFEPRPIPGTEDAAQPFFSPDGQHVAYFAKGQLYRVSLDGGTPIPLARAPNPMGGTWGDDDSIVFNPIPTGGLIQVKATGVTTEKLLIRPAGIPASLFVHPSFLQPLKRIPISTEGGRCPVWSPKGNRLFFRQGTKIMAVDIRPDGSVAGNPRMLFDGGWSLATYGGLPIAPTRRIESDFSVMSNGDLLMVKAEPEAIPTRLHVIFNWFEELNRLVPTGKK